MRLNCALRNELWDQGRRLGYHFNQPQSLIPPAARLRAATSEFRRERLRGIRKIRLASAQKEKRKKKFAEKVGCVAFSSFSDNIGPSNRVILRESCKLADLRFGLDHAVLRILVLKLHNIA
jgi:hypothetical protein